MLERHCIIDLPPDTRPQLIIVVDTEEEFDWFAEPDANANSVSAIQNIHRVQDIFDEYDIMPCYVVDYPIATQSESVELLRAIIDEGRCEIGAHLHPWVNPPHEKSLSRARMFPGIWNTHSNTKNSRY